VRAAGLAIRFVPACLVPTVEPCSWRQLLWTNRQTIMALVNLAVACAVRTITWRGISYSMLTALTSWSQVS
jgi:hypothetical protein